MPIGGGWLVAATGLGAFPLDDPGFGVGIGVPRAFDSAVVPGSLAAGRTVASAGEDVVVPGLEGVAVGLETIAAP